MKLTKNLSQKITDLITALSDGDYQRIADNNWLGRTNENDLARVILVYGNTLIVPPTNFLDYADIISLDDNASSLIDIPLWTKEEGRSDLMISLEVRFSQEIIAINDLRVP